MELPLARPDISQLEIDAVVEVLRSPQLSIGPRVVEFERLMAEYCGTKEAVAVCSGTAALHLVVAAMGIGEGDEVITTPFSFIASSNCILFERATPVLVDIDPRTWNVDPKRMESAITARTKALLPVDVFGQIADMDPILATARKHDLWVIEDSCEALGGRYKGRLAGSIGDVGVFGFYPNKQITTGEGGMIVTDHKEIADHCRSTRNQGRGLGGEWLSHVRLGYNFRLPDINCAVGIGQMKRLEGILASRKQVADWYLKRLSGDSRLAFQHVPTEIEMSWFVFVVRLADQYTQQDRDRIMVQLREKGIGCNNYFAPIHLQKFYAERYGYKRGDFPICESLAARTIALPFYNQMAESDVDRVCKTLTSLLQSDKGSAPLLNKEGLGEVGLRQSLAD